MMTQLPSPSGAAAGEREWLTDAFSVADILMADVLRSSIASTGSQTFLPATPMSRVPRRAPPS
jgi:hypothetical protein